MIRWTFVFPERNVVYEPKNEEDDLDIIYFMDEPFQDTLLYLKEKESKYYLNMKKVCLVARQIIPDEVKAETDNSQVS